MQLNTLAPAEGAKKDRKRVGRGIGSGDGKTGGRGHKGQKSRSGGYHKIGFEGGQMPIQRRLPKFGFTSRKAAVTAEIRLSELNDKFKGDVVDINTLLEANLINKTIKRARIIKSGKIEKALTVRGIHVTAGAKKAIEAAGGTVEVVKDSE